MILSEREAVEDFIQAGLQWAAIRDDEAGQLLPQTVDYLKEVTSHGIYRVPGFILTDLSMLLLHGHDAGFHSDQRSSVGDENPAHRVLAMRYEREFLNRLLQLPKFHEIVEIIQTSDNQQDRIKRLLVIFSQSLGSIYPATFQLNPIVLRGVHARDIKPCADCAVYDAVLHDWLQGFLANLARDLIWNDFILEQDVFELAHWNALQSEHARLGCRQIIALENTLPEIEQTRLQVSESESDTETRYVDHTYVPSGGVAELTNRGSIENLVASELLYIDETHQGINLFDMRYIEGELLYYMRDEGALLRKRRMLYFILDLNETLHLKPLSYDYQMSVLAQALMLRLYNDLNALFENDSVRANFHYIANSTNSGYLEQEARLLKIMLADEIQHARVEFRIDNRADIGIDRHSNRKPYVIVLTEREDHFWYEKFQQEMPGIPVNLVQLSFTTSSAVDPAFQVNPETVNTQRMRDLRHNTVQQLFI